MPKDKKVGRPPKEDFDTQPPEAEKKEPLYKVGDVYADMKIVEIKPDQERSIGFVYPVRGKVVTRTVKGESRSFYSPDALLTQPLLNKKQEMVGETLVWEKNISWMSPEDFGNEVLVRATKYMIPTELLGK